MESIFREDHRAIGKESLASQHKMLRQEKNAVNVGFISYGTH